jgi:hypothetical protein
MKAHRKPPAASRIAIVTISYYIVCVAVLDLFFGEIDPLSQEISYHLDGEWRLLATSSFFAVAVSIGATAISLRRTLKPSFLTSLGRGFLFVASIGIVAAGLSPPGGGPLSKEVHDVASDVALPSLLVGLTTLTVPLRRTWPATGRRTLATVLCVTWLVLVFFGRGFPFGRGLLMDVGIRGLLQRSIVLCWLGWMWLVNWRSGLALERTDGAA